MSENNNAHTGLYIQMHSVHGLFRGHDLELGRDSDTGGQILYVLELAKEFARSEEVGRVDILTRMINDPDVPGYSMKMEPVIDKLNIVRIKCGPDKYIRKEELWQYFDEYIENTKKYNEEIGWMPDVIHSNYADAGYICTKLAKDLGVLHCHTGHSLGKPKMDRMGITAENFAEYDKTYHFTQRNAAEQYTYDHADIIITSTNQERVDQYGMYDVDVDSDMFHVVPPGIDLNAFYWHEDIEKATTSDIDARIRLNKIFKKELEEPDKPAILSLSRLDSRKNLAGLIEAYGKDKELQELANLIIFAGRRDDPFNLAREQLEMFIHMELLVDKYDIVGNVALPKHVVFDSEVPELYRMATRNRGIFINSAFTEPFGLTALEAAACGLPMVLTDDGGPRDIVQDGENGYLVNVQDHKEMAEKMKKVLRPGENLFTEQSIWDKFSINGRKTVEEKYTWTVMAKHELGIFKEMLAKSN